MEGDEYMKFKPGMITTIEPGIYISSSMDVDDKWKGIGVRIEDDILVTKDGNENLTSKVPSDPKEIESLMS
jgi:Xaa-Pro aminopeptidase